MRDRYIAFDVETPNYANDRMSAIGVAVTENGEYYSIVSISMDADTEKLTQRGWRNLPCKRDQGEGDRGVITSGAENG